MATAVWPFESALEEIVRGRRELDARPVPHRSRVFYGGRGCVAEVWAQSIQQGRVTVAL